MGLNERGGEHYPWAKRLIQKPSICGIIIKVTKCKIKKDIAKNGVHSPTKFDQMFSFVHASLLFSTITRALTQQPNEVIFQKTYNKLGQGNMLVQKPLNPKPYHYMVKKYEHQTRDIGNVLEPCTIHVSRMFLY